MAALSVWGGLVQAPSADPGELSTPTDAACRPRRHLVRRVAGVGVVAATVVFAVVHAKATMAAARLLGGVRLDWLGLALGAEAASLLSFCLLRRALLRATEGASRRDEIVAVTLAGSALSRLLPGGAAWAGVWAYGQLRRRGTGRSPAIWVLLVAGAVSSFALFVVVVVGIEAAGGRGPVASLRWPAAGLASVPVAAAAVAVVLRRCPSLRGLAQRRAWRVEARSALSRRAGLVARALWRKLRLARPSPARWLRAWLWGLLNWVFDGAVLVIGVVALGGSVPWRGIVVAYGISQIATSVPVTPGGLGVAEASLAGLLVAYGMPGPRALAAVVLYRAATLGVVGALGAGAWLHLRSSGGAATIWSQHERSFVAAARTPGQPWPLASADTARGSRRHNQYVSAVRSGGADREGK